MEQIKELTRRLIANSFKELMLQVPFEKITIKTITDHANVIRPTFYNHFHDKYELMECILKDEILDKFSAFIEEGKAEEGITFLFTKFYDDREYYKKAFEITGQNGFIETLSKLLTCTFSKSVVKDSGEQGNKLLTTDVIAQYYTSGLITVLKLEIEQADNIPLEDIISAYQYLMQHTIYEVVK